MCYAHEMESALYSVIYFLLMYDIDLFVLLLLYLPKQKEMGLLHKSDNLPRMICLFFGKESVSKHT